MRNDSRQIAIVGMGCRLPGGIDSPGQLMQFLVSHGDAVTDIPADRWQIDEYCSEARGVPGKAYATRGAFLKQSIFDFDSEPFAISPREADRLDPQQRLLLEVTWEAFEDAGIPLDRARGSRTAVLVGAFNLDCQSLAYAPDNQRLIDVHTSAGASMTMLSNRLSYTFDLRGPSLTIDTACSSSLVAVHLACQAILHDDCSMALAGGVNVMLSPAPLVAMCKGQFLAPDGRSKAFDANADGYGRGEGAAIVLLKRLDCAVRDGDRIYAVICASGVNQDGRTDGISMPNGDAQRCLAASVLDASGLAANDVGYVEAHGTGTRVGDPVEARALGTVYGVDRKQPIRIGSLKSNLGHMEAAAGVVGLIKAVLSVHHRIVLPQLGPKEPNPEIPFRALGLRVATHAEPWPNEATAAAAVNSFGYGGTNAHVVIKEWHNPTLLGSALSNDSNALKSPRLVPLSAMSERALFAFAARLEASVSDEHWSDQVHTLARHRTHLPERAVILAESSGDLRSELSKLASSQMSDRCVRGRASMERKLLWAFTGMGPQWWAMGRELLDREPAFKHGVVEADQAFCDLAGWSPLAEMLRDEASSRVNTNAVAQPTNFLIQVGLVRLLGKYGVPAHGLLGHSGGEVTAAWAAECLSLEEATRVVFRRSQLQQRVAGKGTMLAAAISAERVQPWLAEVPDVTIAAFNAPTSVTLAGGHDGLAQIARRLEAEGIFHRMVAVEVAYHSPHMDPLEAEFIDELQGLHPRPPNKPLYSTLTGVQVEQAVHDERYWWNNTRCPVMLQRAVDSAIRDEFTTILEIGPHPVLAMALKEVLGQHTREGHIFHCMKRGQPEQLSFVRTAAQLYASGVSLDWSLLQSQGKFTDLPHYSFQRERHWLESKASQEARVGRESSHPLLARRDPGPTPRFTTDLMRPTLEYLQDHRIDDTIVFPGAAYVEAALAAGNQLANGHGSHRLDNLKFEHALVIRPEAGPQLLVDVDPHTETIRFYSRHGEEPWEHNASARIKLDADFDSIARLEVSRLACENAEVLAAKELYQAFTAMGLNYGARFQALGEVRVQRDEAGGGSVLARLQSAEPGSAATCVHPPLLDAAFQALLALASKNSRPWVPVSIQQVSWTGSKVQPVWAYGHASINRDDGLVADLKLAAEDGTAILEVRGLVCQELARRNSSTLPDQASWLHMDAWQARPWPTGPEPKQGIWGFFGTAIGLFRSLADKLRTLGIECRNIDVPAPEAIADCTQIVFAVETTQHDPAAILACDELRKVVVAATKCHGPRLVVVTGGAQPADAGDRPDPVQSALWGFARVIMTELPELDCRLIDLPGFGSELEPVPTTVFVHPEIEEEVAVRGDRLLVRRLVRQIPEASRLASQRSIGAHDGLFRDDRTYLVTGGQAGFGLATAKWIVEQGAGCIILGNRHDHTNEETNRALEVLRRQARVECRQLDVTSSKSISDLLDSIDQELPPLGGIFHAAMVLDDRPIQDLSIESLRKVLLPKAYGAWLLHEKTAKRSLDYFVLYSSVASLVGNPNQASYAAANAYLDGLASMRKSQGLAATSVAWGAIADVGVVARNPATEIHSRSLGFGTIAARQALSTLESVLPSGSAGIGIFDVNWNKWRSVMHRTPWSRLQELSTVETSPNGGSSLALGPHFLNMDRDSKLSIIHDRICQTFAEAFRLGSKRLDPGAPLRDYGLDSLMAAEVQQALEKSLGATIPVIELLGGVSVNKLVERVFDLIADPTPEPSHVLHSQVVTSDLRADILSRICAQPPYFDLSNLQRDGEWLFATAAPLVPGDWEDEFVSSAEAARHLAILGSCAASLRCSSPGKFYYPIVRAEYVRSETQKLPLAREGDQLPAKTVHLRARCTDFDIKNSRATAEAELLDATGNPAITLFIEYHVIPEANFTGLFRNHREATQENGAPSPYQSWHPLPSIDSSDGIVSLSMPPVDPLECLGHFLEYPALPVSIMVRYAIQLMAEGSRRLHGWNEISVTVRSGSVHTESFIFAHEPVTLVASCIQLGDRSGVESWKCDVRTGDRLAASFDFGLLARPSLAQHTPQSVGITAMPPSGVHAIANSGITDEQGLRTRTRRA